ncbi:MAG: TonB-dependent receptor [Telluria sp.]
MKKYQHGAAAHRLQGVHGKIFVTTVLAGMISSAFAQTTPTATAATSAQSTQGTETVIPTVNVSGFRSSLALSAMEKRENIGLTDTVSSEDMGKFPDPNIADALARVPGVQVTRAGIDGEGLNISIRGMGPAFTRVLLNGAPMASASAGSWGGNISANREVDMDFLPSELFRRATVYKSQQASVMEGGIAGTVDMRSVRPFDKKGLRSAFTLSGNYRDQHGSTGHTGSALVSNTWDTSNWGRFGALAGVAWGKTDYKTDAFQVVEMRNFQLKANQATAADKPNNTGGGHQATPDTVPAGLALNALPEYARSLLVAGRPIDRAMLLGLNPGASIKQIDNGLMGRLGRHMLYEGTRERVGGTVSLQWQPNDQLDFYLDTIVAKKGNEMVQEAMNVGTRANVPIPIGMEFDRSDCTFGCTVTKATLANTFWGLEYRPMKEETEFYSINPGFELRLAEKWTIDGHVNKTRSTFWRDMPTVLLATRAPNSVIQYDNTVPGQPPTYSGNLDVNDPANFGWYQAGPGLSGLRMSLYERTNTTQGGRLNLTWGDSDFNIKVGGTVDDIERRYQDFSLGDAWANVACGNNMNVRFFTGNTQIRNPGCDGRSTPGPMLDAGTAYPGYGTKATAGQTTPLAYLGSVVTNARVPEYARPSDNGFITLDWNKFAKDTDYQYFRDNIYHGYGPGTSGGYIREKVTAGYVETNGRTQLFGGTLRYNLGVRYAETDQTIGTTVRMTDPRNNPVSATDNGGRYEDVLTWEYESTKYHNVLPSLTAAYNIRPDLIARLSTSKSMTRANPTELRQTRLTLDQSVRQGTLTNPKLKPFEAMNLDVGLEYYMSREAYVAVGVFAKDITNRPGTARTSLTLAQLDALYGSGVEIGLTEAQQAAVLASGGRDRHLVELSSPLNIDTKLKVRGVELTWQQPLDMLPVKGFGFTTNFTYAKQTDDNPDAPPIAGVPPRTHNLTLYYERNGLSARVSRNYTAEHVSSNNTGLINVPGGAYAYAAERTQVDATVGANLKKLFGFRYDSDLTLSVVNANNALGQTFTQFSNAISDNNETGRSYTLSLRTKF